MRDLRRVDREHPFYLRLDPFMVTLIVQNVHKLQQERERAVMLDLRAEIKEQSFRLPPDHLVSLSFEEFRVLRGFLAAMRDKRYILEYVEAPHTPDKVKLAYLIHDEVKALAESMEPALHNAFDWYTAKGWSWPEAI